MTAALDRSSGRHAAPSLMVAYSFDKRFIEPITPGTKRQTIRNERRRHARPGETLQPYTAMRTKYCRLIGTAVCESLEPVRLSFIDLPGVYVGHCQVWNLDEFARGDGLSELARDARLLETPSSQHAGLGLIRWRDFQLSESSSSG
jgi:hypothetical protein